MLAVNLILLPCAYLAYKILQSLYRLTFHPLAKFPGPKFAAVSRWHEVYYEVFVGGAWSDQINLLHQEFGPIVRIGPNELHIIDPEYYDTLFNFNPRLDKRKYAMDNLQHTPSHEQHKLRRHGFESFFSRANVTALESLIRECVDKLCMQLSSSQRSGEVVNISLLYRCLTADIITSYAFGRDFGFLERPTAMEPFFKAFFDGFKAMFFLRESKVLERMVLGSTLLPDWFPISKDSFLGTIREIRHETYAAAGKDPKENERRTILTELPRNEKLPPSEKTSNIIFSNAVMLVSAGLETTGHTLETATVHLNVEENAPALERLKEEVRSIWPEAAAEMPSWKTLETLPYLQAVIKESLRLSLGVSARLSRINHHEPMHYNSWTIPAGTEISMTQRDIHFNQVIFPDSWKFDPDRWLGAEGKGREKYLTSFSRGSRGCIGINLAMAELYIALATVVRRFDLTLYESDRRDVDVKYDYFVPVPATGHMSVSVKVV